MNTYTTLRKPKVLHFRAVLTDHHRDTMDAETQQEWLLNQAVDGIARILAETDGAVQINATYNPERHQTEVDHTITILLKEDKKDGTK